MIERHKRGDNTGADPIDLIVPLLQRIQQDLADIKRELKSDILDLKTQALEQRGILDAVRVRMKNAFAARSFRGADCGAGKMPG